MRTIPLKTIDQLEMQAMHRGRQPLITECTADQVRVLILGHGHDHIPALEADWTEQSPAAQKQFSSARPAQTGQCVAQV